MLNDGVDECGLLKEIVLLERMQLIELHGINAHLHIHGRLQYKGFFAFIGQYLHSHALQMVQVFTSELFQEELRVWLYLSSMAQRPATRFTTAVAEAHVVVAVVDKKGLKARMGKLFHIDGHESQISRKMLAALALFRWPLEGYRPVGWLFFFLFLLLLSLLLHLDHMASVVVLLANDHHLAYLHRHLEAIFVFHQHNVLSLETGHTAASHFAHESYFISNLHRYLMSGFSCKSTQLFPNCPIKVL